MEPKPNNEQKFETVLKNNSYYFINEEFEEESERTITQLYELLMLLKRDAQEKGLSKDLVVEFIRTKKDGLKAVLTLAGFSRESLLRLITFIRLSKDDEIAKLTLRSEWATAEEFEREWPEAKIASLAKKNEAFAKGIVNLLFEGATCAVLRKALPLFEFKKLSVTKLSFTPDALIDTIIRYKVKGSYSGSKQRDAAKCKVDKALEDAGITWEAGKLANIDRTMDYIIPDKQNPKIIVEASFVTTTSSGMGDKAKTETKNFGTHFFGQN
ncbi:MAG: DpnII family type II restriction endonuclease [Limisphaerales bacterium]